LPASSQPLRALSRLATSSDFSAVAAMHHLP
jgi:hypothetical protein